MKPEKFFLNLLLFFFENAELVCFLFFFRVRHLVSILFLQSVSAIHSEK